MASLAAESLFWVAAAVCAIAQLAILRGVVGDGAPDPDRAPSDPPHAPATHEVSRGRRAAEAAWALLPGLALALVLVWTWHAMHVTDRSFPPTDSRSIVTPPAGA